MRYPEIGDHLIIKESFSANCESVYFCKGEIVEVTGLKLDRNHIYVKQKLGGENLVYMPPERYQVVRGKINKDTLKLLYGN